MTNAETIMTRLIHDGVDTIADRLITAVIKDRYNVHNMAVYSRIYDDYMGQVRQSVLNNTTIIELANEQVDDPDGATEDIEPVLIQVVNDELETGLVLFDPVADIITEDIVKDYVINEVADNVSTYTDFEYQPFVQFAKTRPLSELKDALFLYDFDDLYDAYIDTLN